MRLPMMIFTMRTQALCPMRHGSGWCIGHQDRRLVALALVRRSAVPRSAPHTPRTASTLHASCVCRHVVAPRGRREDVNPSRCAGELVGADVMWLVLTAAV